MPTLHGFVRSLETRSSGWVEVQIVAPHASNSVGTAYITDLDGDLSVAHRKLAQVAVLRDALTHTLPVMITYQEHEKEGNVIEDVTALPSRSIAGRLSTVWVEGVVLGVMVRERSPESTSSPYVDEADEARVMVLLSGGNVETYGIDLQRPYTQTGHAICLMCQESRRTRRQLRLQVHIRSDENSGPEGGFAVGAEWPALEQRSLKEVYAFVEHIGQRSESYDGTEPRTAEFQWIRYTTAPEMIPEGDISQNGSFQPVSDTAWLHVDSPLCETLRVALRKGLQVCLGIVDQEIHSVELLGPLGSAARPIWVTVSMAPVCEDPETLCVNIPTIRTPADQEFNQVPQATAWRGHGYFNKGIWRFVILSDAEVELLIDGKTPCANAVTGSSQKSERVSVEAVDRSHSKGDVGLMETNVKTERIKGISAHAYMNGMHLVQVVVRGRTCQSPFRMLIYRIR